MKVVINWTRCCHKPHHDKPQQAFPRQAHRPSTVDHWIWPYGQELQMQRMLQWRVATCSNQHDYHVRNAFETGASWPTADEAGQNRPHSPPPSPSPSPFQSTPLHLQQLFGNHLSTTSAFMAIRMGCSGRQGLAMAVLGASCPFNLSKWLAIEIETKIAQSEYDVGAAKHKCFQMHRALKEGFGFSFRPLELVLSY